MEIVIVSALLIVPIIVGLYLGKRALINPQALPKIKDLNAHFDAIMVDKDKAVKTNVDPISKNIDDSPVDNLHFCLDANPTDQDHNRTHSIQTDYAEFSIFGETVYLYYTINEYGINTVADLNGRYYHLGKALPDISSAIKAWKVISQKDISDTEQNQIMIDNHLASAAI